MSNLMLGVNAAVIQFTVRESCAGAEHWVGNNSTRLGGQPMEIGEDDV